MLVFPQLMSGGCAQYPFERTRTRRVVRNRMEDGSSVTYLDGGAGSTRWTLPFDALSDQEAAQIQALFDTVEGRARTFTFLDPGSNLLAWSEDLTQPVWHRDPAIQITGGGADPYGGNRAVRVVNAGQAAQRLSQTLAVPATFTYCLSAYVRSSGGSAVSLIRSAGSGRQSTMSTAGGDWSRIVSSGSLAVDADSVTFAVELQPGGAVELFGLQAEAQPAPSAYCATQNKGGVRQARFGQDELRITATAPAFRSTSVRIVSTDGV